MRLTALRLHNVRRFAGSGIAVEGIGDGVNVLCAANEYGKSTCFDALHALFFQPHTGTASPIQSLRPYSGGSPLVEADIATADGRFRISKQFYAGRRATVTDLGSGRLVAQADEAERFIAALVRGGTAGPAGLLWVRQGNTGLDKRSKGEDDETRARESILSSVQGEVEAITGGRRMETVRARCEEELGKLVTATGRPKAGGPYLAAMEERDRLAVEEQRLAEEVRRLRAALDRRRAARARLTEIDRPEETAERLSALKAAEAELAQAKARQDALRAARAEAELAARHADAARSTLDAFAAAADRLAGLSPRLAAGNAQRDAAREQQRVAIAAGEEAARVVEAAEREEREARELLGRLDKALRAREAAERLAAQRQTLEAAEAARAEIERIEAALKALSLPDDAVKRIEAMEADIAARRAAMSARAPVLRMRYRDGATGAVRLDGTPLPEGERALAGSVDLDIDGIGTLTLRVPREEAGAAELATAEAKHRALLASLGLESLAEAYQRQEALRQHATDLALARQRLALLVPNGLAALREEITRLAGENAEKLELKGDPVAARLALDAAGLRVEAARIAAREQQPRRMQADSRLIESEATLHALQSEREALIATLGPEPEREARHAALRDTFTQAQRRAGDTQQHVEELTGGIELTDAEARVLRLRSIVDAAREEAGRLRVELAALNSEIGIRADEAVEEAWAEVREALEAAQARVERFTREVATLTRLDAALEAARSAAHEHYFKPVMRELQPLLGLLFEDATVTFDEATLTPRSVRRNGLDERVDVLSGGMREQLAVLTRLAFARLLAENGEPAPVILDDALVYSDDDRIERMFDALHRQARQQQIIVFSCRQRAFQRLGGHALQPIPWAPER
ncbi:AAA family ATPase [Bosea sp. 117]|uniref:AAA family ATPase n=1 Tax=Bosea sp. 117 TaxID=1125973 RepID=UPI000493E277|nr:AAA family ATPase [Bosea sp. 117]